MRLVVFSSVHYSIGNNFTQFFDRNYFPSTRRHLRSPGLIKLSQKKNIFKLFCVFPHFRENIPLIYFTLCILFVVFFIVMNIFFSICPCPNQPNTTQEYTRNGRTCRQLPYSSSGNFDRNQNHTIEKHHRKIGRT